MKVLYERCAGLDVHKKFIAACCITPGADDRPQKEKRVFRTMTRDLLTLSDWLEQEGCTHVAMESTGAYWKPVYNILEQRFHVMLSNAKEVKNVPGRKTDISDAEWIADLARHGLIRGSFIPPEPTRVLRELTRYRTAIIRQRAAEVNRLQKILEDTNIKLSSVATDITGVSAQNMLSELLSGKTDVQKIADLARGRMRNKMPDLHKALEGKMKSHHQIIIHKMMSRIKQMDEDIAELNTEIERHNFFFEEDKIIKHLDEIPGVDKKAAQIIIAEIGTNMHQFPTAGHLASWAGMCPGNNKTGGKRKSGKTTKGSPWIRSILVQCAHAAGKTKDTYLSSLYHRMAARKGKKRAAVAVGHAILIATYHIIKDGAHYQELGAQYLDRIDRSKVAKRLKRRLESIGYQVELKDRERISA